MVSVTQRIKIVKQPRGGYLPIKEWKEIDCGGEIVDSGKENIHPTVMGMAVDYLTRFMTSKDPLKSFEISLLGASMIGQEKRASGLLKKLKP